MKNLSQGEYNIHMFKKSKKYINNLGQLNERYGLPPTASLARLSREVAKHTSCNSYVAPLTPNDPTCARGVKIGATRKGSDYYEYMYFPFTLREWNSAWKWVETTAGND